MIYVIDDEQSNCTALTRVMKIENLPTKTFVSPGLFLQTIRTDCTDCTDCIIIDINMQEMNGFELQARLKESGNHAPIIFMSTHVDDELRKKALQAGACGFFSKPIDKQALIDAVKFAITQSSKH